MAGRCRTRLVDPPNAACVTIALRIGRVRENARAMGFAGGVERHERARRTARHVEPDGMARRRKRGVRDREAERFADDLRGGGRAEKLATAAGRRARAAAQIGRLLERDLAVHESHADRLHAAGIFAIRGRKRDAAGHEHARQIRLPASAIIIAGNPLSQVATPSTPRPVGSDRISRRNTIAASLLNGRLSNIAVVPCDRPSHGSVHAPANGTPPAFAMTRAAASTSRPTSQCPV